MIWSGELKIRMTRVKICGLTKEEDVDAVVDAGADAVGFVSGFPRSPRDLPILRAASLISRVPPFVTAVLVTTAETLTDGSEVVKRAAPGAIQLYGDSITPALVRSSFHARLIKPYAVRRQENDAGGALSKAEEAVEGFDALLVDTYVKDQDGGTGLTSDWSACAAIRRTIAPTPLILSGGLRPENVQSAVSAVGPFCVDVSSGVESAPGVKDAAKVRSFIGKVQSAEERRVAP